MSNQRELSPTALPGYWNQRLSHWGPAWLPHPQEAFPNGVCQSRWQRLCCSNKQSPNLRGLKQNRDISCSHCMSSERHLGTLLCGGISLPPRHSWWAATAMIHYYDTLLDILLWYATWYTTQYYGKWKNTTLLGLTWMLDAELGSDTIHWPEQSATEPKRSIISSPFIIYSILWVYMEANWIKIPWLHHL